MNKGPAAGAERSQLNEPMLEPALEELASPLSFAQQRLWFLDQLEPDSPLYNLVTVLRLRGQLEMRALEQAFSFIVSRHEALRTRFPSREDGPVQVVEPPGAFKLRVEDVPGFAMAARELRARQLIAQEAARPFDLRSGSLFRALLIRLNAGEQLLVINMHHIISDEWSMRLLFKELSQVYGDLVSGHLPKLPPPPLQYADFAVWQRDWLEGENLSRQLEFWTNLLGGNPPLTELPTDRPRPPAQSFKGATLSRGLSLQLSEDLQRLAGEQRATLFMLLLAAFEVLVHRYSQQDDVVIGTPIAGRTRPETQNLIGFFVNTLPLRVKLDGAETFLNLLARVRDITIAAYAHQDVPFEKIVEALQPERSLSHMPFTRLMFVFQAGAHDDLRLPGIQVQYEDVESGTAKFDVTLVARTTPEGLRLFCEYNTELFEAETINRFLGCYETLLTGIVSAPHLQVSALPLLTDTEKEKLLFEWNKTETDYGSTKCIHELFEMRVDEEPGAVAVVYGNQSLSYRELNGRANQLARYLKKFNVGPDVPVAVCAQRSPDMIVAMLAILKAGGAYLPLDAGYPRERLGFMLEDTKAPILLTQQAILSSLPCNTTQVLCLDADWELIAHEDRQNLPNSATPDSLAYVMYTSGSTGKPKGVAVPHRGVIRLVRNTNYIQFSRADRVAQVSNVSFDAATFEVWGALLNGGQLVGITQDVALSPKDFAREVRECGISAMFLTTALFNAVVSEVPGAFYTVNTLMAGGEALDPKWVRLLLADRPPKRFLNGYGPTENTTFTCCHHVRDLPPSAGSVPIGRPIANTQVYILDRYMQPVPVGVPGELYAGGDGVARGYWNRPELTQEKFVPDPFGRGKQGRQLYRTGDLARWRSDGTVEFLGRIDQQVKIRGFRIELSEIETVLSQHPDIRECAVAVSGNTARTKRLVAYIVPHPNRAPTATALRNYLAQRVPEYMVPALFTTLNSLPLNGNGKLDRKALPEPEQGRPELDGNYASPRDEVEQQLTAIWENVLGVHPVGLDDRFFELGGHSLLAVKLISQIEKHFGHKLRLATIFQAPTVRQLAAILKGEINESSVNSPTSVVEIQGEGSRPPLFLVHGAGGGMFWGYVNLSRHLGPEQPVYSFKSRGLDEEEEPESIEELATLYVADLRKAQPHGPYYLGGYCFGGNVAFEMALQLEKAGEQVTLLALLNCSPPNSRYTRIPWSVTWWFRLARNMLYWGGYFLSWSRSQRREFFKWKWEILKRRLTTRSRIRSRPSTFAEQAHSDASTLIDPGDLVDLSSYTPEQQRVWQAHIKALLKYHPKPFNGRIHLFRSPGHPLWCSFDPDYGWSEFARGGVDIHVVPGAHEKILEEPCANTLAQTLSSILGPGAPANSGEAASVSLPGMALSDESSNEPSASSTSACAISVPVLDLPADHTRPPQPTLARGREPLPIPPQLWRELTGFAAQTSIEPETVLFAVFSTLLHRYTGNTEFLIGSNQSPVRCNVAPELPFRTLALKVHRERALVTGNHDIPTHTPLQVALYFKAEEEAAVAGQATSNMRAATDLALDLNGTKPLEGAIQYSTELFEPDRIKRMSGHFIALLESALRNPNQSISTLRILTEVEQRQLLVDWAGPILDFPKDKTVWELFSEQARRTPAAEALITGDARLTYAELRSQALLVARALHEAGVDRESLVAVCLGRSWQMVAALLGTFAAGRAYVPVDPAYPRERIAFTLEDANAQVLITERKLANSLPCAKAKLICVEDILEPSSNSKQQELPPQAAPAPQPSNLNPPPTLAYVIYTSGSTGKPKGVAIEHRSVVAFVYWARTVFTQEELSGVLASTSICFDLSVFELFVPLAWGGRIILAENALALPSLPAAGEVTLVNTVPSAMRELLRMKGVPSGVTTVNLAGEPLATELVDRIYAETAVEKVYDLYGPTETTTYSTFTLRRKGESPTIGRPVANERVLLLDSQQQLVPAGVPGEVYIGGAGVARGYLARPELTAERFVPDPFHPGDRLYRTGDLARWRADGNLEYIGRIDHQVKIRGFRIELGEIESVLKTYPAVHETVVIAREDQPGNKRLVAYVVPHDVSWRSADELRAVLRTRLPEYMVPSAFVFLPVLPQTPNGKLDRKALPPPESHVTEQNADHIAPRTELEHQLAAIWREVLGTKRLGVRDNFFDLGGHSLLAMQVVWRVRQALGRELPVFSLFDLPTIEALAQTLSTLAQHPAAPLETVARDQAISASFVQERLWIIDQLEPGSDAYNVPTVLRIKGRLDVLALQAAFRAMLQRHETLRTTLAFKDGSVLQEIREETAFKLSIIDLSKGSATEIERHVRELRERMVALPFDLASAPLIRSALVRLSEQEHELIVVMHHAVCDGWSLSVFFSELATLYKAFASKGGHAELSQLPYQYAEYAHWQRSYMQGPVLERELAYWREALAGAPPYVRVPEQRRTQPAERHKAGRLTAPPLNEITALTAALVRSEGASLFMLLITALGLTLRKCTGQDDMVIGTVVAGRNRREMEDVIGCFMNFLPLRLKIAGATPRECLRRVRQAVLEAQAHQECPFEKIVEAVNPERQQARNPLYNVALLLQNFPEQLFPVDNLEAEVLPAPAQTPLLDLRFEARERAGALYLDCEYKQELYEPAFINRLLTETTETLKQLVEAPDEALKIPAHAEAAPAESMATGKPETLAIAATFTAEPLEESLGFWRKQLGMPWELQFAPHNQVFQQLLDPGSLFGTNQTGANLILLRLEDWGYSPQAESEAGKVTRRDGPDALDNIRRTATEFVHTLKTAALRSAVPHLVIVCPPSAAAASSEQLTTLLTDIEAKLERDLDSIPGAHVVTSRELLELYPVSEYNDATAEELGQVPYTPILYTALATTVARKLHSLKRATYKVIVLDCDHTLWSGVCGEDGPRGIRLEPAHRELQEFMVARQGEGMLLCLCSKNNEDDVEQVFLQGPEMPLRKEHFTAVRLNWLPKSENLKSLARELNVGLDSFIFVDDNPVECAEVEANCPEVLTLRLPEQNIAQFLQHCWAFDQVKVTAEDRKRTEMYRQNHDRELLRLKSPSLADFIAGLDLKIRISPMTPEELPRVSQLTQRTNQFNFTGIRRTEAEFHQLPRDKQALAVHVSDRFGEYGLVGVMVLQLGRESVAVDTFLLSCRVLGRGVEHRMLARLGEIALQNRIPWVDAHFTPSPKNKPALSFLESIGRPFKQARNENCLFRFPAGFAAEVTFSPSSSEPSETAGEAAPAQEQPAKGLGPKKFTECRRIALECGDAARVHALIEAEHKADHPHVQHDYAEPRTELEKQLCAVWEKLLRVEKVGIQDDFFELGGHSLLAVRLFAAIEKLVGRKFPLITLFQAPTVEQLARVLSQGKTEPTQSLLVSIQPQGSKPPLFLVHGAGGDVLWGYANLATQLGTDQPIYGIKSRGQAGQKEFATIEEMAGYYLEHVQAHQPHGPYYLGGYCFGGNVAYEMARQLQAAGEQVALLALLDAAPANAGYERVAWLRPDFPFRFGRNFAYWVTDFRKLTSREKRLFLLRKARTLGRKLRRQLTGSKNGASFDLEEVIEVSHFPQNELDLWRVHLEALTEHVEREYPGRVVLLRTRGQPLFCSLEEDFCWGKLAGGGVQVRQIPGAHEQIFMEPNVQALAAALRECLAEAHTTFAPAVASHRRQPA